MARALRSLLPVTALAVLLTAALDMWIRVRPLDMPAALQVTLSLVLLAALIVLIGAVLRVARTDPAGGVDIDPRGPS
jgi:hypothetical protein